MSARVGASREAPRVTIDYVFGALDLDPPPAYRPDDYFIAGCQTSVPQYADGKSHLMFSGDLTHHFTILAVGKGER